MFLDIALSYDPASRRCDMVFNGTDFAMDSTPATALLISMGSDRRARGDDELPAGHDNLTGDAPVLLARRGFPGDALDPLGRRRGSRFWLNDRAKQTERVRRLNESYGQEAFGWLETERGQKVTLAVRWVRAGMLGIEALAGKARVAFQRGIG